MTQSNRAYTGCYRALDLWAEHLTCGQGDQRSQFLTFLLLEAGSQLPGKVKCAWDHRVCVCVCVCVCVYGSLQLQILVWTVGVGLALCIQMLNTGP